MILVDDRRDISGYVNIDFDTANLRPMYPTATKKQIIKHYEDSLLKLTDIWKMDHAPIEIEVVEGLTMTTYYTDSKRTIQLERERDSLINAFNKELIQDTRLIPVILMSATNDSLIASNLPDKMTKPDRIKTVRSICPLPRHAVRRKIIIDHKHAVSKSNIH